MSQEDLSKVYEFENQEWLDSLEYIIQNEDESRVREILGKLQQRANRYGIDTQTNLNTSYINTISPDDAPEYPGDLEMERKIESIIRWNALAMVVRANKKSSGIGGHISTYASASTLFEVGFQHFFRGKEKEFPGDMVYFQGHASPGVYARSFLEGRFSEQQLENFRRELEGGLSSYPHPRLMPDYWNFPTVSMGLGVVQAIYQARFNKYLENRKLKEKSDQTIWGFFGDGEMDEPEAIGALPIASREKLNNLIFVINCNLQRLDGPVRGNYKVIQELERLFKGAGWKVIKVIWGSNWDPLLEKDENGQLVQRMDEVVDGQYQKYVVEGGKYFREDFFGDNDTLRSFVEDYSDEELSQLERGGHDPVKVYQAYREAVNNTEGPTVILAQTVKGYGLGEAGEASNVTHKTKKLEKDELKAFRERFALPLSDEQLEKIAFYHPGEDSEEIQYLLERRKKLGGFLPKREVKDHPVKAPADKVFQNYMEGSGKREVATTMVMVQLMSKLMKDKNIGDLVVPIVPDESRTFGMDALFRQVGIYSPVGQRYEPVDEGSIMYYREEKDGAILEEGITEAGSISSFIAAGTAYANHNLNTIPFYYFYSMFGFQRTGDFMWAAADARARGFLIGATSGRTTLPGEGLQHQDGQSHILAYPYTNCLAYDPTFAYEVAVIVREGIRRMYIEQEDIFYYITVTNDTYQMPSMPKSKKVEKDILRGMYKFKGTRSKQDFRVNLLGSGSILLEVIKAAEILKEEFDIAADIWSVTSYKELYRNTIETERWNRMHPDKKEKQNFIQESFKEEKQVFVAATDYLKALPLSVAKWFPGPMQVLGTDGFGRSDNRENLRDFFENNAKHIAWAAMYSLKTEGMITKKQLDKAQKTLKIDPEKVNPATL